MRKIILGLLLSICSVFHAEAQAPDWVTQRPTSSDAYIVLASRRYRKPIT